MNRLSTKLLDNLDKPLPAFPALRLNLLLKPVVLRSNDLGLLSSSEAIDLAGAALNSKPARALWGASSAIATSGASIGAIALAFTPTASPPGDGIVIANALFMATPSTN